MLSKVNKKGKIQPHTTSKRLVSAQDSQDKVLSTEEIYLSQKDRQHGSGAETGDGGRGKRGREKGRGRGYFSGVCFCIERGQAKHRGKWCFIKVKGEIPR